MSEITPYINQHGWGRDLLDKLGKAINLENGGLNTWVTSPSVFSDGQPLDEQHFGYTGINTGGQPKVEKWNGESWETVFQIPIQYQGEPTPTSETKKADSVVVVMDPGRQHLFFFVCLYTFGSNFFRVEKIARANLQTEWTTSVSINASHAYAAIGSVSKTSNSFFFDGAKLFFAYRSQSSVISAVGLESRYCCINSNGTLLWTSSYSSANWRVAAVIPGLSQDVYFVHLTGIDRVNVDNGTILSQSSFAFPGSASSAYGRCSGTLQKLILFIHNGGSSGYALKISTDLSTLEATTNLFGTPFAGFGAINTSIFPHPTNDFYYFAEANSGFKTRIWRYSASTASLSVVARSTLVELVGIVEGVSVNTDGSYQISTINQQSLIFYQSDLVNESSGLSLIKAQVPGGSGTIVHSIGYEIIPDSEILKIATSSDYFGDSLSLKVDIKASKAFKQLVYYEDATFSSSGDLSQIVRESNFKSVYASDINSPRIESQSIWIPDNSAANIEHFRFNKGLNIGTGITLFSFFAEGQGLNSVGYTGTNRGQAVAGLGFNCAPIQGNLVNNHNYKSAGAGIFLFDSRISKFFWQIKPTQAQGILTTFPSASGVCLTSSNFMGVGTETPAYSVDVNGTLRATTVMNSGGTVTSDPQIKVGMIPLDGLGLWELCEELVAISFLYKPDFVTEIKEIVLDEDGNPVVSKIVQPWQLPQGIQYGYNAREIQELFPELVTEDVQSGVLYLNREAIPVIFQSAATAKIKQLEQTIAQKDTLLTQLQSAIESLTTRVEALENAAV